MYVCVEEDSRDLTPVVTCLVQLLLDQQCRTQQGFEALVEKEWVALGHRFKDRLGLVYGSDAEVSCHLMLLSCKLGQTDRGLVELSAVDFLQL